MSDIKTPISLGEIRKKHKALRNVNIDHKNNLTKVEKLAIVITDKVGTMGFFFVIFVWTVCWLSWNMFAPKAAQFDPFPAFVLWLFISNMIQIFLMPLIMVGQNLQGRHSEARAEADFDVNTKAEEEIETILQHLENQNELMIKILNQLNAANKGN